MSLPHHSLFVFFSNALSYFNASVSSYLVVLQSTSIFLNYPLSSRLEKEMATHSSVLAWRIPGTGKPGGLPSIGSHRVRHDWSDLAGAAAASTVLQLVLTLPGRGLPHQTVVSLKCNLLYTLSSLLLQQLVQAYLRDIVGIPDHRNKVNIAIKRDTNFWFPNACKSNLYMVL